MSSSFVGYERYVFDVLKSVGVEDLKLQSDNNELTTLVISSQFGFLQVHVPKIPWKNLTLTSSRGGEVRFEGEFTSINKMIHYLMEYT